MSQADQGPTTQNYPLISPKMEDSHRNSEGVRDKEGVEKDQDLEVWEVKDSWGVDEGHVNLIEANVWNDANLLENTDSFLTREVESCLGQPGKSKSMVGSVALECTETNVDPVEDSMEYHNVLCEDPAGFVSENNDAFHTSGVENCLGQPGISETLVGSVALKCTRTNVEPVVDNLGLHNVLRKNPAGSVLEPDMFNGVRTSGVKNVDCQHEMVETKVGPAAVETLKNVGKQGTSFPDTKVDGQDELLHLHEVIKKSGKPNVRGCRIPIWSPWNYAYLQKELEGYHDKEVAELCRFGWPINIGKVEFKDRPASRNWRSALEYSDQLDEYFDRETRAGTLLGPFRVNPFSSKAVISPLSTAEKKGSQERRVIMDLSFPPGDSVNDKIPRDQYMGEETVLKYPGVDALVALIKLKGKGCALMKVDLRRAYKQIFTDPADWNFLGILWKGKLLFDRTMPMGLRSAAMCCQRITNALKYIVEQKGFGMVSYLDDMVSAECWLEAERCFDTIRKVVKDSGAEEAVAKAVSPTCVMIFLGILFDTVKLTLEVSEERLWETRELLEVWLKKTHVSRREVESMVGKLAFLASCVRPGRLFISRMLEFLRGYASGG